MRKPNIYTQLVTRVLLVYALLTVARFLFYIFNLNLFPSLSFSELGYIFYGGLKFDTAALIYLNILFIVLSLLPFARNTKVYQGVLRYLFYLTNGLGLLANFVDIVYYRFTNKRSTSTLFSEFGEDVSLAKLAGQFLIDYWYLTVIYAGLMYVLIKAYRRTEYATKPLFRNPIAHYASTLLILAAVAILAVGGIRGGFTRTTRPITLSNAGQYVEKPSQMALVLNTPFCIIRTIGKNDYKRQRYFRSKEVLEQVYSPVMEVKKRYPFQPKNVVILILESFAREHSKFANEQLFGLENYKGYMPFLDSLMSVSKVFVNAYANGHKSIDALPSVTASLPRITSVPFVLSHRSNNRVNSFANLLKNKGYNSNMFVGQPGDGMGFRSLMKLLGYQNHFGLEAYPNQTDFDGFWGIWDDKFLQFMGNKLNETPQPFVSTFFSLSSHHPFGIPQEFEQQFLATPLPLQRCISYTDHGLRQFFNQVKKMPWYENTVFAITADHTSQSAHPYYRADLQRTAVPLILYAPGDSNLVGVDKQLAQQADVLPTLLNYLHFDEPYISFGADLLDPKAERFVISNAANMYQFAMGEYVIMHDGVRTHTMFNILHDPLNKNNLVGKLPKIQETMESKLKAIVQQYSNRMLDNELTVQTGPQTTAKPTTP